MNTVRTNYPLIPREQTYVLKRKLISVHSIDRDLTKWPNSNNFGIELGEAFRNVQSIRLINFTLPNTTYTFSNIYENTKLTFLYKKSLDFDDSVSISNTQLNNILAGIFNDTIGTATPQDVKLIQYGSPNQEDNISSGLPVTSPATWTGKWSLVWEPEPLTITIPEGTYTSLQIANTLEHLMNEAVFNISSGRGYNFLPGPVEPIPVTFYNTTGTLLNDDPTSAWYQTPFNGVKPFVVKYNNIENKLIFGTTSGKFAFDFKKKEIYNTKCKQNKSIWEQYTNWGLPSYIGFQKENYISNEIDISNSSFYTQNMGGLYLPTEDDAWLKPTGYEKITYFIDNTTIPQIKHNSNVNVVHSHCQLNLNVEDTLYMEIDRYNNIDEIYPYSTKTNALKGNDGAYRVNGSFAKVPIVNIPFGKDFALNHSSASMFLVSDPPLERVDRLVFKFRHHDGRLVDFRCLPFSFTLEFNMLKDEQHKEKFIRVPPFFTL